MQGQPDVTVDNLVSITGTFSHNDVMYYVAVVGSVAVCIQLLFQKPQLLEATASCNSQYLCVGVDVGPGLLSIPVTENSP